MTMNKILLLITLLFCFCGGIRLEAKSIEEKYPANKKVYKLISLRNVDYAIVDRICRPWLAKDAVLVHEKKRNSILVYAEPEVIVRIRKFLDQTAAPEVNIRIDIEKQGLETSNSGGITYRYNRPGSIITYKNGRKSKPRLILRSRSETTNLNSLQFIITQSGSPASLWVGKTIVDPSWLRVVKPKKELMTESNSYTIETDPPELETKMVDIALSLQVLPRYLGNGLIEVEVYPEITRIVGKGKRKAVKVSSLVTKVIVKNGAKVLIGGVVDQKKRAYKNLFGTDFFKRKGISEVMNMYISAKVLKPGDSGR